ncbi:hypothetical protein LTR95_011515 [Oleoguttula sp. CCFEE 5521]
MFCRTLRCLTPTKGEKLHCLMICLIRTLLAYIWASPTPGLLYSENHTDHTAAAQLQPVTETAPYTPENSVSTITRRTTDTMSSSTRVKPTLKRKASEASYPTNSQPGKRSLASRKERIVCTEDRYQDQFPAPLQKKGHSHSMDVCYGCWNSHVESQLESKEADGLFCAQCSKVISMEDLEALITKET